MSHNFKVGDRVSLSFGFHDQSASGTYAVTRLLPTRMNGEPQYRVKGGDDRERVIGEGQIVMPARPSHAADAKVPSTRSRTRSTN